MGLDFYRILGVERTASQADIKSAWRSLAKKYHPDLHPGNPAIERNFQSISEAYELLRDPEKRAHYDLLAKSQSAKFQNIKSDGRGFDRVINDFLRRNRARTTENSRKKPAHSVLWSVRISFIEAMRGGKRRIIDGKGRKLEVLIPPGIGNGQKLRLRGPRQASPAEKNRESLVEIHVDPHPYFSRRGQDILLDVPIGLDEALMGARIDVPTLDRPVRVTIPEGSNSGQYLRLKGRGIPKYGASPAGDMLLRLVVTLPHPPDLQLRRLVSEWKKNRAGNWNPRAEFLIS